MRHDFTLDEGEAWKQARRAAFLQEISATLTQRSPDLFSFDEVSQRLELRDTHYLGVQEVPLDQIAGSVGRYADFTRAFLPREDHLKGRWEGIEELVRSVRGLPPVELYQVGQVYFVRDGHHRVSVARQRNLSSIEAQVWEYDTPIPLEPDSDVDELLCRAAHAAFMDHTGLDRLRPDVDVRLTVASCYAVLLEEIEVFQLILTGVDRRQVDLSEALDLWCDLRYVPVVTIIREHHVLADFPGRTETDLYLWLAVHQPELEARNGQSVLMDKAADDLSTRYGENSLPLRHILRVGDWLATTARSLARRPGTLTGASRRRASRQDQDPGSSEEA
jgi:hypothetical protein